MANIKNQFKKKCIVCGKLRTPAQFYISKSDFHADGRLPMCADCCLDKSLNDGRTDIDIERFQRVLQQCDKPYIAKLYKSTMREVVMGNPDKQGADKIKTFLGLYMRRLNGLNQYQTKCWNDSIFETEEQSDTQPDNDNNQEDYIVISDDGYKYSPLQFEAVLALFKYLQSIYQYQKGSQEYELLKIYAALRLRAEAAAAECDVDEHFQILADCGDILTTLHWED